MPPGDRLQVLRGLRRALAPNGKLIFVVRTFHSVVEGQVEDEQAIWAQQTLAHISASGISLPAPILEFKAQIQRNAARRRKVAWELASPEEIADLLTAGGFRVTDYARMADRKHKTAYNQARAKGSYVFVAD